MKLNVWNTKGKIEFTPTGIFHGFEGRPVFLGEIEVTEPKKVVTKEIGAEGLCPIADGGHWMRIRNTVPSGAMNIRVIYDIEE